MARLPEPGNDQGQWGTILNEYLSQAHKSDGTIKQNSITADALAPNSVTGSAIAPDTITSSEIADGSISETLLSQSVQTKLNQTQSISTDETNTFLKAVIRDTNKPLSSLYSTFFGIADGAAPTQFDSGQALSYVGNATQTIVKGKLRAGGSGARSLYARTPDLGAKVKRIGMRFVMSPPTGTRTDGGLVCIAISNQQITGGGTPATMDLSLHFWTTKDTWAITVWNGSNNGGSGQEILTQGYYPVPLVNDGKTEFEIETWIEDSTITARLADGTIRTASNAKVATYAGNFAFFQAFLPNGNTDDNPGITHVWADTDQQTAGRGGFVHKDGAEVIEGFKAFSTAPNFQNGFQIAQGAAAGKILTSDQYGIASWQTPPNSTVDPSEPSPVKRITLGAIGHSLVAPVSGYDTANKVDGHRLSPSGGHSPGDYLFLGNLLADSPIDIIGSSATAGYTAAQIRDTHLPVMLAAAPTYCIVWGPENDALANGDSVTSATLTIMQDMCQQLESVGTTPILCTIVPAQPLLAAETDRVNAFVANYAQTHGYPLLDFYSVLVDPTTGAYKTGYSSASDSPAHTHPTPLASTKMAEVVRDLFNKLPHFGSRASLAAWNGLAVDGMAQNPLLTLGGEANTPSGWFVQGSPTMSLAASNSYPGNEWTVTRTSADGLLFGPDVAGTAGDVWDLCLKFSATPGSGRWSLGLVDQNVAFGAVAYDQVLNVPSGKILHWRGKFPPGATKLGLYFGVVGSAGSQIKLGQVTLRNLTAKGAVI